MPVDPSVLSDVAVTDASTGGKPPVDTVELVTDAGSHANGAAPAGVVQRQIVVDGDRYDRTKLGGVNESAERLVADGRARELLASIDSTLTEILRLLQEQTR